MPKIMWQPSEDYQNNSQMMQFLLLANKNFDLELSDYRSLYNWSIDHPSEFWGLLWQFTAIKTSKPAHSSFLAGTSMMAAKWFIGTKLNFAENLLRHNGEKLAVISNNEHNARRTYTFSQLFDDTAKVAGYFRQLGIKKNDRIACVLPNIPEAIISMLATTSTGAIWSSCSPDFGKESLYDRFHQIQPKILIICDQYFYNGKIFSNVEKINWLKEKLPSIEKIILIQNGEHTASSEAVTFDQLLRRPKVPLHFEQLPFEHPIYIMYSSGTTGIPKCIVHSAGGTLLQHLKELQLHTDLRSQEKIFYYTTCGWMMWHWYVSSLALGATVIQYDGAPFYPSPSRLFDFIDEEDITVFGTSAKYISAVEKEGLVPKTTHHLQSLKTILSTGSPLVSTNFDYVYQKIKSDLCLASISGGTDIISCFGLGNPMVPVYRGELQCIGLGMSVKIFNEHGQTVINEKGELVCTQPFPSMPVYFWNDPHGEQYHQAYFAKFPGIWNQGDFAEITDRGTLVIYGRSDATLNPGGVRIGTAEIYRQVEQIPEILDALAVCQEWNNDNRILLFLVLKDNFILDENLKTQIKTLIKDHCSPRHVPAKIFAVPDIPKTFSGKIIELAVREIIHGRPVKNISAIANPECLEYFKSLPMSEP